MNNEKIIEIKNKLVESDKIVFFHHVKPDGDSLSSSYALVEGMKSKFPEKTIKWVANVEFIKERFPFLNISFEDVISGEEVDETWTSIVGDNAVLERIYGNEIYQKAGVKICFDHHRNNINFDTDVYWQDYTMGASAIQAFLIGEALEIEYSSRVAILALFGILTDTGNFQFSLADPRPLEAAARLMKYIDNDDLDAMYQGMKKKTQESIGVEAYALNNYVIDGRVAYVRWTDETQKELGVKPDDVARVNLIANIEGADAWIFFIEYNDEDHIRVEFRSLGLPVNEVAIKFGGGGHLRASGAKLPIDWNKATEVVETTKAMLKEWNNK